MGYALAFAPCVCCKQTFGFNPTKVPSLRVNGTREAVCLTCMTTANTKRVELGLTPHPILPDAYQGLPEEDLPGAD